MLSEFFILIKFKVVHIIQFPSVLSKQLQERAFQFIHWMVWASHEFSAFFSFILIIEEHSHGARGIWLTGANWYFGAASQLRPAEGLSFAVTNIRARFQLLFPKF